MAGIFLWLYLQERKDHRDDNKTNLTTINTLQESRRLDAVETRTEVTSVLPGISQSLLHISDKIEFVQNSNKRKR